MEVELFYKSAGFVLFRVIILLTKIDQNVLVAGEL